MKIQHCLVDIFYQSKSQYSPNDIYYLTIISLSSLGLSFSEKAIKKTASGLWRLSGDAADPDATIRSLPAGLLSTTTETFTVTPQGGWLTSSHDNDISIFLPPGAVTNLIQTRMKVRLCFVLRVIAIDTSMNLAVYLNMNRFNHNHCHVFYC